MTTRRGRDDRGTRPPPRTLDELRPGERAMVRSLRADGPERRRLLDLGLLPGTPVAAELRSPLGDPVAYRVRSSVVALRRALARTVDVDVEGDDG